MHRSWWLTGTTCSTWPDLLAVLLASLCVFTPTDQQVREIEDNFPLADPLCLVRGDVGSGGGGRVLVLSLDGSCEPGEIVEIHWQDK